MNKQVKKTASKAGRVAATAAKAAAKAGLTAAAVAGVRELRRGVAKEQGKRKMKKIGTAAVVAGTLVAAGLAARKYIH